MRSVHLSTPTGKLTTRTHFLRYSLLIRRLQRGRASRGELTDLVLTELADVQGSYSRTSLRRDLADVAELFGVVVACCRRTNRYYIDEAESGGVDDRRLQLLEAWEMQHLLNVRQAALPFVQLDARRPAGTQHLRSLLRAVQGRREVRFQHHKYWDEAPTERRVWPLGLKEWAGRWYLLTFDQTRAGQFRTFGLDRLAGLTETGTTFPPQAFDAPAYFRDCFGVTRPVDGATPVELVLAFTWTQGRYVEDQPLHASQTTLRRSYDDDEIRICLRVYWTHEVRMALLAYGDNVAVLAPLEVAAELAAAHRAAAN